MSIQLKCMTKVEGYKNVFEPKYSSDAKFIRQNRKFYLLPCEIVDDYKVFQTMPDGRKIRSHFLEPWVRTQDWEDAAKSTLEEEKHLSIYAKNK